jgi:hypothetical protein
MRIGCDLHARQQTLAMLETTTGEVVLVSEPHGGAGNRMPGRPPRHDSSGGAAEAEK